MSTIKRVVTSAFITSAITAVATIDPAAARGGGHSGFGNQSGFGQHGGHRGAFGITQSGQRPSNGSTRPGVLGSAQRNSARGLLGSVRSFSGLSAATSVLQHQGHDPDMILHPWPTSALPLYTRGGSRMRPDHTQDHFTEPSITSRSPAASKELRRVVSPRRPWMKNWVGTADKGPPHSLRSPWRAAGPGCLQRRQKFLQRFGRSLFSLSLVSGRHKPALSVPYRVKQPRRIEVLPPQPASRRARAVPRFVRASDHRCSCFAQNCGSQRTKSPAVTRPKDGRW